MMGTSNWKFHLAAGSVTIVLSVLLFSFFGSDDAATDANNPAVLQQPSVASDRFIQISRASYGVNCNERIARLKERYARNPSRFVGKTAPEIIQVNNVLRRVSSLCDGKTECSIDVTPEQLGINPMRDCQKVLQVEYRCYVLDRPWPVAAQDYGTVALSCSDK